MFRAKNQIAFHIFHTAALCSYALASREFSIVRRRAIMCDQHSGNVIIRSRILRTLLFFKHTKYFTITALQNWLVASSKVHLVGDNVCKGVQISLCWHHRAGQSKIVFSIIYFEEEEDWATVAKLQSNIYHDFTGLIATNLGWRIIHDFIPGRGLLDESSEFHIVVAWDCRGPLTGVAFFAYTALSADWEGMQNLWPVGEVWVAIPIETSVSMQKKPDLQ